MKKYKQYTKNEFQSALSAMRNRNGIRNWVEVSDEIQSEGVTINEYVYRLKTWHKSASIIIFSSVDKRSILSRKKGSDAVRIIFEWKTTNGTKYCRIKTRYRIDTLFENIEESVFDATKHLHDLNPLDWKTLPEALS